MAVVAAIEFHDQVTIGETPRETDRGHRGLGSRGGHADFFDRWHPLTNGLCHIDFVGIRDTERNSVFGDPMNRIGDRDGGVAENVRAPRADVVDVGFTINVGNAAAFRAADKKGFSIDVFESAHRRVHPTRNVLFGDGEKFAGEVGHGFRLNLKSQSSNFKEEWMVDNEMTFNVISYLLKGKNSVVDCGY